MNRRGFLKSILATSVAPYVVTTAGVLMPVRKLWTPTIVETTWLFRPDGTVDIERMVRRDLTRALAKQIDEEICGVSVPAHLL